VSQENVEVARGIYRSWAKGDFSSVAWADPDMGFVLSGPDWQVHRGVQGMSRAWGEWLQAWDEFRVVAREFIDLDDAVLVLTEFRGRGKPSGVPVESMTGANVFRFHDGKVVRLVVQTDRPNGLEAVGLRELPMLQENVEVVRRAFEIVQEGVRRGDPGAAFDRSVREGIVASNLEWRAGARGGVGVAGAEDAVGREGFVQFMRIWTEDFEELAVQLEEIIDVDNEGVVAITGWHGIGKASHAPVEMRTGMVCTLETRRIVRSLLFIDPNHALKAVGLSE
jgi:ketosteroid isomerase-like protein